MSDKPACRACQSSDVYSRGALPDGVEFAGRVLAAPIPGGDLWVCRGCSLQFRHPVLSDDQYEMLYRHGGHDVWSQPQIDRNRQDFRIISDLLARQTRVADVLDVGCYDGRLLSQLPSNYRRFGVEINELVAERLKEKNIEIVATSIERLLTVDRRFDVVIACDVIEHVADPLAFLKALRKLLRPKGQAIISTGNSQAWLWRLSGPNFWYCYYPEHISFVGEKWFSSMPARANFTVADTLRFNYLYEHTPNSRSLKYLSRAAKYAIRNLGRRAVSKKGFGPPGCGATRDHLVCVLNVDEQ